MNSSQTVQDNMKYVSICILCNLGILKHNDRPYKQLSDCPGQHEIRINLYSLQSQYSETQRPTVWTAISLSRGTSTTWNTYQSVFSAISVFWNTTTDRMNSSQTVQDNMKYVSICILCNLGILKHNDRINSSQTVQGYQHNMKYVSICILCNLGILKHNDRPYETALRLSRGTSTTWNTYQSVFSAISVFWNTTTVWTALSLSRGTSTTWNTYQSVENISLSRGTSTTWNTYQSVENIWEIFVNPIHIILCN